MEIQCIRKTKKSGYTVIFFNKLVGLWSTHNE